MEAGKPAQQQQGSAEGGKAAGNGPQGGSLPGLSGWGDRVDKEFKKVRDRMEGIKSMFKDVYPKMIASACHIFLTSIYPVKYDKRGVNDQAREGKWETLIKKAIRGTTETENIVRLQKLFQALVDQMDNKKRSLKWSGNEGTVNALTASDIKIENESEIAWKGIERIPPGHHPQNLKVEQRRITSALLDSAGLRALFDEQLARVVREAHQRGDSLTVSPDQKDLLVERMFWYFRGKIQREVKELAHQADAQTVTTTHLMESERKGSEPPRTPYRALVEANRSTYSARVEVLYDVVMERSLKWVANLIQPLCVETATSTLRVGTRIDQLKQQLQELERKKQQEEEEAAQRKSGKRSAPTAAGGDAKRTKVEADAPKPKKSKRASPATQCRKEIESLSGELDKPMALRDVEDERFGEPVYGFGPEFADVVAVADGQPEHHGPPGGKKLGYVFPPTATIRASIFAAFKKQVATMAMDKFYGMLANRIRAEQQRAGGEWKPPEGFSIQGTTAAPPENVPKDWRQRLLTPLEKYVVERQVSVWMQHLMLSLREALVLSHMPAPTEEGFARLIRPWQVLAPYEGIEEEGGDEGSGSSSSSSSSSSRRHAQYTRVNARVWQSYYDTRQGEVTMKMQREVLSQEERAPPTVEAARFSIRQPPYMKAAGPYPSRSLRRAMMQNRRAAGDGPRRSAERKQ